MVSTLFLTREVSRQESREEYVVHTFPIDIVSRLDAVSAPYVAGYSVVHISVEYPCRWVEHDERGRGGELTSTILE